MVMGIVFFCIIYFGDGDMFGIDYIYFNKFFFYYYLVIGFYNIFVKCYNCLGEVEVIDIYDVDIFIKGVMVIS